MRIGVKRGVLALVVLAGGGSLARADLAATVNPSAVTWTDTGAGQSLGWRFFVNQPIAITSLGLYDAGDDGLASSHVLGLWRVKKTGGLRLEQSVTISGTGDLQEGHHVFATLATPFTIVPDPVPELINGTEYYERWLVGVWSPSGSMDAVILQPQNAASFPASLAGIITFENYTSKSWTDDPDTVLGDAVANSQKWYPWPSTDDTSHFGVDFEYRVVPVPGAVVLGLIGLSYAGWRLRRRPV